MTRTGACPPARCSERLRRESGASTMKEDAFRGEPVGFAYMCSYRANHPIQDKVFLSNDVFAVFDGHGGHLVAQQLRAALAKKLVKRVPAAEEDAPDEVVIESVSSAFVEMDEEFRPTGEGSKVSINPATGSCACVIMLRKNSIVCSNVGDCRAVLAWVNDNHVADNASAMELRSGNGKRARQGAKFSRKRRKGGCMEWIDSHAQDEDEPLSPTGSVNAEVNGKSFLPLSCDQTGDNREEADLVRARSPDAHAIRPAEAGGPMRVGGSLIVTRSFGDFYLKEAVCSFYPYQSGCPYITVVPETRIQVRSDRDSFIVIASDGLWDWMTNEEVVAFVRSYRLRNGDAEETVARALLENCLKRIARNFGMDVGTLKSMRPGRRRRSFHDDISVVVVYLRAEFDPHPHLLSKAGKASMVEGDEEILSDEEVYVSQTAIIDDPPTRAADIPQRHRRGRKTSEPRRLLRALL